MDLDLAEYDQIDEIKFIENHQRSSSEGSALVTLSSCSNQISLDDGNYESDFVFLPSPPSLSPTSNDSSESSNKPADVSSDYKQTSPMIVTTSPVATALSIPSDKASVIDATKLIPSGSSAPELLARSRPTQVAKSGPLLTICNNANAHNPFGNYSQVSLSKGIENMVSQRQARSSRPELSLSKPIGLLEMNSIASSNPGKLADLMQAIVTRSDVIQIAIPCAYCHELVTCPPSDISPWLNHMNKYHNCKVCPICNRLIGLGPRRDLDIMRSHVVEHLDETWLDQKASRVSFSHGLQQHWFQGSRCSVRDTRLR